MSETEIKVPNIGDFKDVEVIEVLVSEGQTLKKNDPLITIESDKSSVEIPSNLEGKIKSLKTEGPIMAASDYMRMNSDQIRPYTNKSFYSLGTDGFGRSDTRKNLRKFFEVDKEHLVAYGLSVLAKEQLIASKYAKEAIKKYNIDGEKPMPTKL